jgi:hypothetical protein
MASNEEVDARDALVKIKSGARDQAVAYHTDVVATAIQGSDHTNLSIAAPRAIFFQSTRLPRATTSNPAEWLRLFA